MRMAISSSSFAAAFAATDIAFNGRADRIRRATVAADIVSVPSRSGVTFRQ